MTGFILIELMVVLVIFTVFFTLVLPGYQGSVLKSNRAAGTSMLLDVASRQEQYFISNKAYAGSLDNLGYAVDESGAFYVDKRVRKSPMEAAGSVYKINVVRLSSISYTMTAAPINQQTRDNLCKAFTLTSTGVKNSTGALASTECW